MQFVDLDIIRKYNRPGPRYTSYPTAPYFREEIGEEDYIQRIREINSEVSPPDLSLYFHIPFCDTLCYFCGCNMMVTHNSVKMEHYLHYVITEMDLLKKYMQKDRRVMQMHWGGGSPTYLSPEQIRFLGTAIRDRFPLHERAEVSVEIDPRGLTREHLAALREVGFNRCSMGVQDFDEKVQQAVNRVQPEAMTRQTIDWARDLGFSSINIDLMYGLPYQNPQTFSDTLQRVIGMNPDRLAVFNYAHMPKVIKHQRIIKDETLPAPETKLEILKLTIEILQQAGYEYIGMDHFAKPQDELVKALYDRTLYRNFQGYSTNSGLDMHSFGISSISQLPDMYIQNLKSLQSYYEKLDAGELPVMRGYRLTEDDRLRRDVITALMCHFRVRKAEIESIYDIDFDFYFEDSLHRLLEFEDDDLITLTPGEIIVSGMGRLIIRNIAMCFDAYLHRRTASKPVFSRTI